MVVLMTIRDDTRQGFVCPSLLGSMNDKWLLWILRAVKINSTKAQKAFKAQTVNKCLKRVGELENERK